MPFAALLSSMERPFTDPEMTMLAWALLFLIVGLVAGMFGLTGIAGTATHIAWILFVIGIVMAVVFAVIGRRPPV